MKKLICIITIFSSIFLISCKDKTVVDTNEPTKETSASSELKFTYPYTGEKTDKDPSLLTPYMVVIENSTFARPQSGLSEADIVYETSAEGGIPRFLAVFHKNTPSILGPVRSARPYFVTLAKEYALPFGHCGGSVDALSEISNDTSIMSIDEIPNGQFFFRDKTRKAPHNLYTNPELLLNAIKTKGYNSKGKSYFSYAENPLNSTPDKATDISVITNKTYTTNYKFENGKYTKYMDCELAIDANTNSPLTFKNIIVQKTNIKPKADSSYLDIDLIGSGDGYLFIDGKKTDIKWNKDSEYDETKFYDINGKEINLSPGNTIINIIDNNGNVVINN